MSTDVALSASRVAAVRDVRSIRRWSTALCMVVGPLAIEVIRGLIPYFRSTNRRRRPGGGLRRPSRGVSGHRRRGNRGSDQHVGRHARSGQAHPGPNPPACVGGGAARNSWLSVVILGINALLGAPGIPFAPNSGMHFFATLTVVFNLLAITLLVLPASRRTYA